jgi:hypothetical protein
LIRRHEERVEVPLDQTPDHQKNRLTHTLRNRMAIDSHGGRDLFMLES